MFKSHKEQYKCIIVGESGVGKTTFIKRHLLGVFKEDHIKTLGVEVHPLEFMVSPYSSDTNHNIVINVWDTAGDPNYLGLNGGYYTCADMAIIMFDNRKESLVNALKWYKGLNDVVPNIPIAFVWNKYICDDDNNSPIEVTNQELYELFESNFPGKELIKINTKENKNLFEPFKYLLQKVTGDHTISIKDNLKEKETSTKSQKVFGFFKSLLN